MQHVNERLVAHEAQGHHRAGGLLWIHGMGATHADGIAVERSAGVVKLALPVIKCVFIIHPGRHRLALKQGASAGAQVAQLAFQITAHAQYPAPQPHREPGLPYPHPKSAPRVSIVRAKLEVVHYQLVEF